MPTGTQPHVQAHVARIARGTPEFRRTNLAMFSAGFSTFALVYCVQPLMPELARTFHVSAATSALSLSVTTGVLAGALLVVGGLAESWGRKPIMAAALTIAALLTLLTAAVPSWHALLALRANTTAATTPIAPTAATASRHVATSASAAVSSRPDIPPNAEPPM